VSGGRLQRTTKKVKFRLHLSDTLETESPDRRCSEQQRPSAHEGFRGWRRHVSLTTSFVSFTSQLTFRLKPIIPLASMFAAAPLIDLVRPVSYGFLRDLLFAWLQRSCPIFGNGCLLSSALICHLQPPLGVCRKTQVVALRHAAKK
jgi:hypothetical protein